MPDVLYFNGRFTTTDEPVLRVEDRGFQFGDALYEVFKFAGKRPLFLLDHFQRMEEGLRQVEIGLPWTAPRFTEIVKELLERTLFDDGIVYVQVSRGEAERAHFWPESLAPRRRRSAGSASSRRPITAGASATSSPSTSSATASPRSTRSAAAPTRRSSWPADSCARERARTSSP
jgi:D-alanine transaminase